MKRSKTFFVHSVISEIQICLFQTCKQGRKLVKNFFPKPIAKIVMAQTLFNLMAEKHHSCLDSYSFMGHNARVATIKPLGLCPRILI